MRVVTGWLQDIQFCDSRKQPRVLTYGDPDDSFNLLVKRYGGDVPARAMLDELVRVGTVSDTKGRVKLLHKGYVPQTSESAMLDLFSISANDLLTTLEHNLTHTDQQRLQMSVAYDKVTTEGMQRFRQLSSKQAMDLLRSLDATLCEYDKDANPSLQDEGEHRVGLGIYFIQDTAHEAHDDE